MGARVNSANSRGVAGTGIPDHTKGRPANWVACETAWRTGHLVRSANRYDFHSGIWDYGHIGFRVLLAPGQP